MRKSILVTLGNILECAESSVLVLSRQSCLSLINNCHAVIDPLAQLMLHAVLASKVSPVVTTLQGLSTHLPLSTAACSDASSSEINWLHTH